MIAAPDDAARHALERARQAAETAARQSYVKLVAFLAARTGDVALAEGALSEAFASALLMLHAHARRGGRARGAGGPERRCPARRREASMR